MLLESPEEWQEFSSALELDDIKDLLNQVREGLHPLNRISSLEREIEEIRKLLIHSNTFENLESRIGQIEENIVRHNDELENLNRRLTIFESSYKELKDRIDDIKNNDLWRIQQRLLSINNDLEAKASQITEANDSAKSAVDQINELRQVLAVINQKLSDLENKISDMKSIKPVPDTLKPNLDDPRIGQILDEQNRIRDYLEDWANKLRQLLNLADDLDDLKRLVNNLSNDDRSQRDLEDYFQKIKREIIEPILNLMQDLNGQINEAKALINDLKTQLNQLLNTQQPELPPIIVANVPSKFRLMPYIESLPPVDLIENIWI